MDPMKLCFGSHFGSHFFVKLSDPAALKLNNNNNNKKMATRIKSFIILTYIYLYIINNL